MVPQPKSRGLGIVERRSFCGPAAARGVWLARVIARTAIGVRVGRPPGSGTTAEEHRTEHNRQNQREVHQAKKIDSTTLRHGPNRTAQSEERQVPVRRPFALKPPPNDRPIQLLDFKRPADARLPRSFAAADRLRFLAARAQYRVTGLRAH